MSYRNQPQEIKTPYKYVPLHLSTRDGISIAVFNARRKHPAFRRTWWGKFAVLLEEVAELVWAVVWERDPQRILAEALDVIAVLVRIIEGDGKADLCLKNREK